MARADKPSKKHPERLEHTAEIEVPRDEKIEFVESMIGQVFKAVRDRSTWELNLDRWYKKRMGYRVGQKNFPWPGAANINIALIEEKIRKLKPNYINMAFEGDPIVTMEPVGGTDLETAQNAELFMDWLLKHFMNRVPGKNYMESLTIIVDWMLEKGFSVGKVIWEYLTREYTKIIDIEELPPEIKVIVEDPETSDEDLRQLVAEQLGLNLLDANVDNRVREGIKSFRKGERYIKLQLEMTVYNGPRVIPIDPKELIVPDDTTDIETARFVAHRMYVSVNDLLAAQRDGKYENVDEIAETVPNPASRYQDLLTTTKANREGIIYYLRGTTLIEIWEIYTWFDINGDGVKEKVVLTVSPYTHTVLRFIEYPYEHGRWPFVIFPYELIDDRWYASRGVPELLDHYQTIVTNQENAKLDYMTLANSLQFKYRIGSVNPNNIRFIPGQGIPLQRLDDLEQLTVQRLDISFDTEMTKMRGLAEALIGQPDMAMGALMNPQERRTAAEVNEAVGLSKQVFSLDARIFKNALQKMYEQIFDLWQQYGPDEVYITVTNGEPIKMTKTQIMGQLIVVPNGEFTTLSRTVEQQRAFAILQLALTDNSGAMNKYEAWRNYLLKADPKAAKRVMNDPATYQQIQQQQQQMAELEFAKKMMIAGRTQVPTPKSPGEQAG